MTRGLLGIGGLVLCSAMSTYGAVDVYYIDAEVNSIAGGSVLEGETWVDDATDGPEFTDTFGSETDPVFLTTPFTFNHSSTVQAPSSVVGNGLASALGVMNASISADAIQVSGRGYVEVAFDDNCPVDVVWGGAGARLSLNFQVPADQENPFLILNGTASTVGYGELLIRLSEEGAETSALELSFLDSDMTNEDAAQSFEWNNEVLPLTPGALYALDLYASAPSTMAYADADLSDLFASEGKFDLSFSVVPEPSLMLTLLGSSVLLIRRRRGMKKVVAN